MDAAAKIRSILYEESGEDAAQGERCPGDGCEAWDAMAGSYEEKAMVCRDCLKCKGTPPPREFETDDSDEVTDLADEIRRLISIDNCKIKIDWDRKEFYLFYLFQTWREIEKEIKNLRAFRIQSFIKNFKM